MLGDFLAPEPDVLSLAPLGRVPLDDDVRALVNKAFREATLKGHRDRLCQLLERQSYCCLAQIRQLHCTLLVGSSGLQTDAEKDMETLVLSRL